MAMEYLSPETAVILMGVSLVAGFIDAIAGGGGLLTIPALLAAGLPTASALATNKLQSPFGSFSASLNFIRKGYVSLGEMWPAIACTFAGAALGAILVQSLDPGFLRSLIPFLLIASAAYFIFSPRASEIEGHRRIGYPLFGATVGTVIGFYDGFFGPGTGSFFTVAYVTLLGFPITKATAHTKVLNFTSNIASLMVFIAGGKIVWTLGFHHGYRAIYWGAPRFQNGHRPGRHRNQASTGNCVSRHDRQATLGWQQPDLGARFSVVGPENRNLNNQVF